MLIKEIVKSEDKKYLDLIDEFEEVYCGWYNVPFEALTKDRIAAILNLTRKYNIYICGVVDLEGIYPEEYRKVKKAAYCIYTFKAEPLKNCRKDFYRYTGFNGYQILLSEYFCNYALQDKIDEMLYKIDNTNDTWKICFKLSKDKKYLEFYEYTDVF